MNIHIHTWHIYTKARARVECSKKQYVTRGEKMDQNKLTLWKETN